MLMRLVKRLALPLFLTGLVAGCVVPPDYDYDYGYDDRRYDARPGYGGSGIGLFEYYSYAPTARSYPYYAPRHRGQPKQHDKWRRGAPSKHDGKYGRGPDRGHDYRDRGRDYRRDHDRDRVRDDRRGHDRDRGRDRRRDYDRGDRSPGQFAGRDQRQPPRIVPQPARPPVSRWREGDDVVGRTVEPRRAYGVTGQQNAWQSDK